MFSWIKKIADNISNLSNIVDKYKKVSVIQSLPTVAYVNKAKSLMEENKFDEAEVVLLEALDISKQDAMVYKYLGRINERKYKFDKAIEYYETSSELNSNDKDIYLRLAMCQLYSKQFDKALVSFEVANRNLPYNTDVYTGWGMTYMQQKKYANALEKFSMAAKLNKYNFSAILLSAVMEIRLEKYSDAEEKLQFLVKVAPNETSLYEYANLMLIKENYNEAKSYANKAIDANKKMLPAYLILVEVAVQEQNYCEAKEIFNTALENGLENELLYVAWGNASLYCFDYEQAKQKYQLALEKNSQSNEARCGMALLLAMENDFELLNELKEKNLKEASIQQATGIEAQYNANYDYAIEMYKKALKTDKNYKNSYLLLARTYQKLQNTDKTRENYEAFIQEVSKNASALIEYSKWLINIKDYSNAQRKLNKAEKLEPQNNEILNLLFFVSNILVRENICEYNVKEVIKIAQRAKESGNFEYQNEEDELRRILNDLKGNN